MDLGLRGKNAVVLGASRGIGRAIALTLADEGANVAVCARGAAALDDVAGTLRAKDVRVHAASCDIADAQALGAFLDDARAALGGVDVLVHNASALAVGPDAASWEASLAVDLMAAVHACDRVVPWMREAGGGSILLVSSISGFDASPMPDYAYTTTKAALIAYAKKLAILQAPHGIRVNALAPGSIEFPGGVWATVKAQQPAMYDLVRSTIPSGRLGTAEEVADAAVYLVSSRARWVTGATLIVDGGQHKSIR
jgi:3-oxoacyl-[acyl-carrier protein] reductase